MATTGPPPSLITTALVTVSVVFPVLALIAIFFRYRARRVGRLALKSDDWWIAGTWIITLSLSINAWVFGSIMGINHYKVDPAVGESKAAQCLWVQSLFLQVSLATVKISILLFYKRIFSTPKFVIAAWVGIVIIVLWGLVFFFLIIFQVDPVSFAWTGIGHFTVDATAFGLAQAGTSIGLDVVVLGFPLPVLSRLHMRTERKVAVTIILWLGGFCCVAAIVRLILLKQALSTVVDSSAAGFNLIFVESKAYIFTIVEPNCSIIAACLPCYGPLIAGGRSAESLVASVRSVLSLGSGRSPQGSTGSRSRSQPKATSDVGKSGLGGSRNESLIELKPVSREWSSSHSQGQSVSNVEPLPHENEDIGGSSRNGGINVTKTYETRQEEL